MLRDTSPGRMHRHGLVGFLSLSCVVHSPARHRDSLLWRPCAGIHRTFYAPRFRKVGSSCVRIRRIDATMGASAPESVFHCDAASVKEGGAVAVVHVVAKGRWRMAVLGVLRPYVDVAASDCRPCCERWPLVVYACIFRLKIYINMHVLFLGYACRSTIIHCENTESGIKCSNPLT
jgi:hypothetical protein